MDNWMKKMEPVQTQEYLQAEPPAQRPESTGIDRREPPAALTGVLTAMYVLYSLLLLM